eukprot:GHVR01189623.1.p3 GENE.GHVR01189623.1~~GHVR01189623.1.p3  ORF type:complete len:138 (-),score=9.42 GHVR01189623.1:43-456(-)
MGTCPEVGSRGESKKRVSRGASLGENRAFRLPPDRPGRIAARSPASLVRNSAEAMPAGANATGPRGQEQWSEPRCLPRVCGYVLPETAECDLASLDQDVPTSSDLALREAHQNSAEVCRLRKRGGAASSTEVHLVRA